MNKRLYVGNLNYDITEKELNDLFSQVGSVIYTKIINRPDGKSKGFGFIEIIYKNLLLDLQSIKDY